MANDEKPLSNSVAGEVNYSSSTGQAECKLVINLGKGIPQNKVQERIDDLLSRWGGKEHITVTYK